MARSVVTELAKMKRRLPLERLGKSEVLFGLTVHEQLDCSRCGEFPESREWSGEGYRYAKSS